MFMLHALRLATVCTAGLLAVASPTLQAETLVYGSWPPSSDFLNEVTLPEAFAAIEKETGGKVKWDLISGGQLADGRGTFAAVADGVMDAGLAIPIYVPDAVPTLALMYSVIIPGDDPVVTAGAAIETIFKDCPECLEEARDYGVVLLGGFASASYRLMCTTPVASVADLKGKRVRATGGYGEIIRQAGGTPLSLTLTDAVSLLQRGGLDCAVGAREWLQTYGYGDFAKHVTDAAMGSTGPAVGLFMNRDRFKALSPEVQRAHLRQSATITARHTIGNYVRKDQASFDNQIKTNGVRTVAPTADLVAIFENFPATDRERLIANGKQIGVANPEALLDAYARNVQKWQTLSGEIQGDESRFAEKLWQEVFQDLDVNQL